MIQKKVRAFGTPESRKKELDACMRKEDEEELIENSFRYKETKDKEDSSERADQSQPQNFKEQTDPIFII